jgi:hypothetical protein
VNRGLFHGLAAFLPLRLNQLRNFATKHTKPLTGEGPNARAQTQPQCGSVTRLTPRKMRALHDARRRQRRTSHAVPDRFDFESATRRKDENGTASGPRIMNAMVERPQRLRERS